MIIFRVINWAKSKLLTGPNWGSKKGQLGPMNNIENLRAQLFFYKKWVESHLFIVFWQTVAQLITLKMAKLGPANNSTAFIHMYICCRVIIWVKFGVLESYCLGQVFYIVCQKHYACRGFNIFCSQSVRKNVRGYYLGFKLAIFMLQQTWRR